MHRLQKIWLVPNHRGQGMNKNGQPHEARPGTGGRRCPVNARPIVRTRDTRTEHPRHIAIVPALRHHDQGEIAQSDVDILHNRCVYSETTSQWALMLFVDAHFASRCHGVANKQLK